MNIFFSHVLCMCDIHLYINDALCIYYRHPLEAQSLANSQIFESTKTKNLKMHVYHDLLSG